MAARYRKLKEIPVEQRLVVRRSHIHGWGLFTLMPFAPNDMIVEYMGEKIRRCVADQREKKYEEMGLGSCYLFALDASTIIDATRAGGPARFINHCCGPNADAKVVAVDGVPKLVIVARRALAVGEEVTYDYKFEYENDKIACHCGAAKCRGSMN
ncbi:hypothetical protein JKP88DRAFT_170724 [Tribonema minus]|uniref:[histone H3]-lysine(4) N-trimethyltransferase n=1 Tax=Tribonema minus TaxID=303371 RepID=A0A835YK44_9STRA|nr:hypothetical protein JKP88DRAFT_170724 [Tribonema minus]